MLNRQTSRNIISQLRSIALTVQATVMWRWRREGTNRC